MVGSQVECEIRELLVESVGPFPLTLVRNVHPPLTVIFAIISEPHQCGLPPGSFKGSGSARTFEVNSG